MENNTTNPDEILLNPEYLKKIQQEKNRHESFDPLDFSTPIPPDILKYIEELEKDPLRKVDNELLKGIFEYLNDPNNCQQYQNEKFKSQAELGNPPEETSTKHWNIHIPIFSIEF